MDNPANAPASITLSRLVYILDLDERQRGYAAQAPQNQPAVEAASERLRTALRTVPGLAALGTMLKWEVLPPTLAEVKDLQSQLRGEQASRLFSHLYPCEQSPDDLLLPAVAGLVDNLQAWEWGHSDKGRRTLKRLQDVLKHPEKYFTPAEMTARYPNEVDDIVAMLDGTGEAWPSPATVPVKAGRTNSVELTAPVEQAELSKVEKAILIYLRDPSQSQREVARQVPCSASLLQDDRFQRVYEAQQAKIHRGSKSKDGTIEATD